MTLSSGGYAWIYAGCIPCESHTEYAKVNLILYQQISTTEVDVGDQWGYKVISHSRGQALAHLS